MLELAAGHRLLHAILSSSQGADSELLPLLTTNSEPLLAAAKMIREHVAPYDVPLEEHRTTSIDMVVRLVLSHVMQPTAPRGPPRHRLDRRPRPALIG